MTKGRTVRGMVEGDSIPELFIPQLISPKRPLALGIHRSDWAAEH
jgi:hypothetical protein